MPAKRPRSASSQPTAPKPELAPSVTERGRFELLMEQIVAQNAATIEAVETNHHLTQRSIRQLEDRLTARLDVLEAAVRQNSADIRQNTMDIQQNSADIRQNTLDIQQNSADIRQNTIDIQQNSADIRQNTIDIQKNSADIRQNTIDIQKNSAGIQTNSTDILSNTAVIQRVEEKLDQKADVKVVAALGVRVTALERRTPRARP